MENSFGSFLRQRRLEKNLTQKELAKLLFVSESAISKWEKDSSRPDIALLPKLSEILGVSEHELITASIDNKMREEKTQAKKWRTLSFTWSLFFYIAYAVALIPCFICNLAIDKTLSWFWIVVSALLLAFTFTNLPKLIKKYKLLFIPLSQYLALVFLLGVCCAYTQGTWFWVAILSVFLGLIIIFAPIYIAKYAVFSKIKKYSDFVSVFVGFAMLHVLLIVINLYTLTNGYAEGWWYLKIALPVVLSVHLVLNILLSVRFLKANRFFKTSILLFSINIFLYAPPLFIKAENPLVQREIDDINIFKANLYSWQVGVTVEQNIHLIICLALLLVAVALFCGGFCTREHKEK